MRAPVLRLLPPLALLPALAGHASTPLPGSGELTCESTAIDDCDFRDPASGLHFTWPRDWPVRRLVLVTEDGPHANARLREATRWIGIEYLPDDPSQPQSTLLWVAVLPRVHWIAQSGRLSAARAPGVEVATSTRYVAVAGVSAANPYPSESRDAKIFDALLPSPAEISLFVQFPE